MVYLEDRTPAPTLGAQGVESHLESTHEYFMKISMLPPRSAEWCELNG